jgi:hypothetical protein
MEVVPVLAMVELSAPLMPSEDPVGLPRFHGQVDKGHAMTIRLSIDDPHHQDQASVHGATEG